MSLWSKLLEIARNCSKAVNWIAGMEISGKLAGWQWLVVVVLVFQQVTFEGG
jgi:hypothetical protein